MPGFADVRAPAGRLRAACSLQFRLGMRRDSRRDLRRAGAAGAALFLLCAIAAPSRASPVLSAEMGLDAPVLLRSGLGSAVVVREGSGYFVLYGDAKGAGQKPGSLAARIGAAGSVLDPLGILAAGVPLGRLVPGKQGYLVFVDGSGPWAGDVVAMRLGPGAVPMDLAPFRSEAVR
ncbi:MAG: hypothetical protein HY744_17125 [Deltaproteobacteria bacterium]|nr:hypothetical protein [Deltaproteobacteria bacterium]